MKINFLGSSHGYAEKNRFPSATLIETEEYSYLLDAGAPVDWIMVNNDKSFGRIRGIFITHMHNDHVSCLSSVIERLIRYGSNKDAKCFFPSEKGKDGFLNWEGTMHTSARLISETIKLDIVKEGKIFDNGDMAVSAKRTLHFTDDDVSFAYIFEANGKKVFFSGDMGSGFTEYLQLIGDEHYDLVVCEMAHANFSQVVDLLKNTNTARMIINHYNEARLEGLNEEIKNFPFPVEIAFDGMEIEL